MWHGVPFACQRRPIVGVLRMPPPPPTVPFVPAGQCPPVLRPGMTSRKGPRDATLPLASERGARALGHARFATHFIRVVRKLRGVTLGGTFPNHNVVSAAALRFSRFKGFLGCRTAIFAVPGLFGVPNRDFAVRGLFGVPNRDFRGLWAFWGPLERSAQYVVCAALHCGHHLVILEQSIESVNVATTSCPQCPQEHVVAMASSTGRPGGFRNISVLQGPQTRAAAGAGGCHASPEHSPNAILHHYQYS